MAAKSRKTEPLSPIVKKGHARLVLLAGNCPVGMTFSLSGTKHEVGREGKHIPLMEDPTVSKRHATFSYSSNALKVTDEKSFNGIYLRISERAALVDGDWFRVGGLFFRFEELSAEKEHETEDGTLHFVSPHSKGSFRIVQILEGGKAGLSSTSSNDELIVGGVGASVAFTADPHLSTRHCRVFRETDGSFGLEIGQASSETPGNEPRTVESSCTAPSSAPA